MIKIENVNWLSKTAQEAEVCLSDGDFQIVYFSQPFYHEVKLPLYAINTNNIVCSSDRKYSVEKKGESFEYKFSGKILDKEHIKIGEFIIQLDVPLPKDIEEGYISFECERVDIW